MSTCNMVMRRRTYVGLAAAALLTAWTGCHPPEPDRGTSGGRIDPHRTTGGDRGSDRASMPALYQFGDQAAQALVLELSQIDQVQNAPEPLILELGDLRNLSHTPTQDFELIQHRLRGQLRSSKLIRQHFKLVEGVARLDRELERVSGGDETGGTQRYDPEKIYLLSGDFFESRRGGTRRYYFEFKLIHLSSREIVWADEIDLAQR